MEPKRFWVDTHCHLNLDAFEEDLDQVLFNITPIGRLWIKLLEIIQLPENPTGSFYDFLFNQRDIGLKSAPIDCRGGRPRPSIILMSEIPSNAVLAKEFLREFDDFSIGSNDMTQLVLMKPGRAKFAIS